MSHASARDQLLSGLVLCYSFCMTNTRTDAQTGAVTREITSNGWKTTQVSQPGGTWWNIRVERAGASK